ncbi:EAL domain-containing protein [Altererythrobacter sp. ZODW24]|uniref:putative bifunctional diguanylate cyclase/phosphodiesterase n=1 Tax=Altererythrobacter sp. ZODW24 TaxID=2185142 RepID=UPI000DF784CA|nr:EAL domain-containing protein [Altererythrobacter sp. ZODW24]
MPALKESLPRQNDREFRFLREQVEDNMRLAKAASIAGLFNAVVVSAVMWGPAQHATIAVFMTGLIIAAGTRLFLIAQNSPTDLNGVHRLKRAVEIIALSNGVIWSTGLLAFTLTGSASQYIVILILYSGMMGASISTYSSMARAGSMFILPLGLGGLASLLIQPGVPTFAGVLLVGSYLLVLLRSLKERQARFRRRMIIQEQLRDSAATVKLLLNDFESQAADWLWEVDAGGRIIAPNARFAEAAAHAPEILDGCTFTNLFRQSSERKSLKEHLEASHGFRDLALELQIGGETVWWTLSGQPTPSGGMRGVASDVSAQKRAEERVSYMAHYDGLTDLANRFQLNETLRSALSRRRHERNEVAILCLDLDGFKSINDTLGHPLGDKLLCKVARRIEDVTGEHDCVARLGGDEFAVLLFGPDAESRAGATAAEIIESIGQPYMIDGLQVLSATSIGIAVAQDDDDAPTLLKKADLALYSAKEAGRNRAVMFEPSMDEIARNRRELEMDLHLSITAGDFELYYQPLIDIESGNTVAYEALIRWNHPERGVVLPDEFIPLAEDTGLIVQMGEWVIREAVSALRHWPEHLRVSVNLSPIQMRSPHLISTIVNAVAAAGVAPSRLELEITENVLMNDSEVNIATLHKLRDFGVRISLDDFGTGYSSLNYLRAFPFDKIKIDRCFVEDMTNRPDCQAIISAITGLASDLGMTTTAEGVELAEQLVDLRDKGCTEAQGYLFSRPEKAEQFTDLRHSAVMKSEQKVSSVLPGEALEEAKRRYGS